MAEKEIHISEIFFTTLYLKLLKTFHGTSDLTYIPSSGRIFASEVEKVCYSTLFVYFGIIVICGGHCSWIIVILIVRWDVISMIIVSLHYIVRRFITLLYNRRDVNL